MVRPHPAPTPPGRGVTRREAEVLRGVQEHLSNAEIAARLFVSERTVESHVSSLLRKLGVASRRELARLAAPRPAGAELPSLAGALFGRSGDIDDVVRRLGSAGLVTLTGPGGVGKTRLALEAAARCGGGAADGVWWVDLSAVGDDDAVAERVVLDLGGHQLPTLPALEALRTHVRDRCLLVLLDNCEHVVRGAAAAAQVLLHGGSTVLATSREPLGVAGEVVRPVAPLAVDDAVALLADRARAAGATLPDGPGDEPVVAELCRRLDGLPLALELVAPRLRTFAPEQLVALLDDRFPLLAGQDRGARPGRHRTLHDALEWSYDLLDEPERSLFVRLGVFRGSFGLDALEAVCPEAAVVEVLPRLVDRSLVLAESGDAGRRFRLLESLRQFAESRLPDDVATVLRTRLLAHLVERAAQAQDGLRGPDAASWLVRLRADHDTIAHLLDWAVTAAPDDALRLVASLHRYWEDADLRRSGIAWAERALAAAPDAPAPVRVAALAAAASLLAPWDEPRARLLVTEAESLSADLGDASLQARVRLERGRVEAYADGGDRAVAPLRAAIEHYRFVGDPWWAAEGLALLSYVQEPEAAIATLTEAHRLVRLTGDRLRIANTAYLLAAVYVRDLADPARAEPLAQEVVALARQLGSEHEEAHGRSVLAQCCLASGDAERATELARECLRAFRRLADHRCESTTLLTLALSAALRQDRGQTAAHARAALDVVRLGGREQTARDALGLLADLLAETDPQGADALRAAAAGRVGALRAGLDELLALAERIPY